MDQRKKWKVKDMKVYVLLMMGGSGTRLGADIPKQYIEVEGKPVFLHIVEKYDRMPSIDGIFIVSNPYWIDFVEHAVESPEISKVKGITSGGATRSESVLNGLEMLREAAEDDDVVLIHDATHPYVDIKGTEAVIDAVVEYGGATLAGFEYDTMYRIDAEKGTINEVIPRQELVSGASPEAFRFGQIYDIYANSSQEEFERMTSAGAIALQNGIKMKVIKANTINLKITYPEDLKVFRLLASNYFFTEEE